MGTPAPPTRSHVPGVDATYTYIATTSSRPGSSARIRDFCFRFVAGESTGTTGAGRAARLGHAIVWSRTADDEVWERLLLRRARASSRLSIGFELKSGTSSTLGLRPELPHARP
jgi:hypothetical protein